MLEDESYAIAPMANALPSASAAAAAAAAPSASASLFAAASPSAFRSRAASSGEKSMFSSPSAALTAASLLPAAASASLLLPDSANSTTGHPWLKYLMIFLVICFLVLLLVFYFAKKYIPDLSLVMKVFGYSGGTTSVPNTNTTTTTAVQPKTADTQIATTDLKKTQDEEELETNAMQPNAIPPNATSKPTSNVYVPEPMPDDAGSRTQSSKSKSGAGFCYIGEDRGFRSCIKVGDGDTCMSGDIFPTEAICVNPNLRQ